MMADNQLLLNGVGGDDGIFVYTGGEQEVPRDVKRVRIDENVDTILAETFSQCRQLIEVEGHNKLRKVELRAFYCCYLLRRMTKMTGLIEIEEYAFYNCHALSELELDKLEIIGDCAFPYSWSLRFFNLPSIRRVGEGAFHSCYALTDAVFGEGLERIGARAFWDCKALRRIVIPLKDNLIIDDAFIRCEKLSNIAALDGGIHTTISTLHMESWRNDMQEEIDWINPCPKNTMFGGKSQAIRQWIDSVLDRMEHYKSEHQMLVKEAMTLLELALWKAKLLNEVDEKKCAWMLRIDVAEKKVKVVTEAARKEHRVTCGASIVIKNVLPFLALK